MIAASDVSLVLEGRTILDHLSFEVETGESVALVGPNGSGKTSILRCLLGLVPFTGRILIGGHDAAREPVPSRTLMSYMPQKPAFTHQIRYGDVCQQSAESNGNKQKGFAVLFYRQIQ